MTLNNLIKANDELDAAYEALLLITQSNDHAWANAMREDAKQRINAAKEKRAIAIAQVRSVNTGAHSCQ